MKYGAGYALVGVPSFSVFFRSCSEVKMGVLSPAFSSMVYKRCPLSIVGEHGNALWTCEFSTRRQILHRSWSG